MTAADTVLAIEDLVVDLPLAGGGRFLALDRVSLTVRRGEILGLVGESGSGKSMLALAVLGLTGIAGQRITGRIALLGEDVLGLSPAAWRRLRGSAVGMVFQDPMTGLNPVRSIGSLLVESVRRHQRLDRGAAQAVALEALRAVGIPSPEARMGAYPHQLSGGLRQRGDDRAGADQPAGGDHRRRADDRARRHHTGANPRPPARPARRSGGRHPDHP